MENAPRTNARLGARYLLYGNPATIDTRRTSGQPSLRRRAPDRCEAEMSAVLFPKGPFRVENTGRKFRNFASESGRETYNANREDKILSSVERFASRSCFCPLNPFFRSYARARLCKRRSQQRRLCGTSGTRHRTPKRSGVRCVLWARARLTGPADINPLDGKG